MGTYEERVLPLEDLVHKLRVGDQLQEKFEAFIQLVKARLPATVDAGLEQVQADESLVLEFRRALCDADGIISDLLTDYMSRKPILLEKVRFWFFNTCRNDADLELDGQINCIEKISRSLLGPEMTRPTVELPIRFAYESGGLVFGRDDDKEKVMDFLFNKSDDSFPMILPIVGIQGIGKTTLARLVINDKRVRDHFEMRLWYTVSSYGEFNLNIIAGEILQQAHGQVSSSTPEITHHEDAPIQHQLARLLQGKRVLLVLDDIVWKPSEPKYWQQLSAVLNGVGSSHGSKILVTSRDKRVANLTNNAASAHVMKGLSEEASLLLLMKVLSTKLEEENNDMKSNSILKETLSMCAGVPLAIITAGMSLRTSSGVREQYGAIIVSGLKRFYDALSSDLKQFVAQCSLFPKDCVLNVHEMINIWNAHRVKWVSGIRDGQEIVQELVSLFIWRDLVIDDYDNIVGCKMDPFFHNLGRFVAKGCNRLVENSNFQLIEEDVDALHVSIRMEQDHRLDIQNIPKNARTLIFLNKVGRDEASVVVDIFTSLKQLRVLRLASLSVSVVGELLGTLKHLTHLDLSESALLDALPVSISKLRLLETLILKNCCSLKELPTGICKLLYLRELDLSGCSSLTFLPSEIDQTMLHELDLSGCTGLTHLPSSIGRLTNLVTLGLFVVREKDEANAAALSELRRLKNLKGHLEIKHLHRVTNSSAIKLQPLELKLQSLKLCWDSTDVAFPGKRDTADLVLKQIKPHTSLMGISLQGYCGYDDALSNWLTQLPNLVKIDIGDCNWCTSLTSLHHIPCLKIVKLCEMSNLEYFATLDSSSSSGGDKFFPALEVLSLKHLNKLRGWKRQSNDVAEAETPDDLTFPTFSAKIRLDVDHTQSLSYAHGRDCLTLETLSNRILRLWDVPENIQGEASSSESMKNLQTAPFTSIKRISLAQLKTFKVQDMGDIRSLPVQFFQQLSTLQHLEISHGRLLTTLPGKTIVQHLTALLTLKIVDFPELDFCNKEDDTDDDGLRSKLCRVQISAVPKMKSLPWWFQHLTELKELVISDCVGLKTLEDDNLVSKLTSLRSFEIYGCEDLKYISEGVIFHLISTLDQSLKICGCPELDLTVEPAKELQSSSSLRQLYIQQNNIMKQLPRWIQRLSKLEFVEFLFCKNLEALPEWFIKHPSLQELRIECCGELSKCCGADRVHLTSSEEIQKLYITPEEAMQNRKEATQPGGDFLNQQRKRMWQKLSWGSHWSTPDSTA